jgi:Fe-S-cluster containining protein
MSPTEPAIEVETPDGLRRFPAANVYFTFASTRLGYDCVSCGAKCCRGFGYELRPGEELRAQMTQSAPARFFVDPCEAASHFHMRNLAPGCFFLTGDNRCGIEVQQGYAAKPETCRLFPFNQIGIVGSHLLVAPHPDLCPLDVMPVGRPSATSDHAQLCASMAIRPISTHVAGLGVPESQASAIIDHERSIVALSERYLNETDYRAFAAAQLDAAHHAFGEGPAVPASTQLDDYLEQLRAVLGAGAELATLCDEAVCRALTAATPSLRAHVLLWQADKRPLGGQPMERLPRMLLALYCLAFSAHSAGMVRVTYQSVMTLFLRYSSLLMMLARLDAPVMWRRDVVLDLSFGGDDAAKRIYARIVQALLAARQSRNRLSLATLLTRELSIDGLDRVLFLKRLADKLTGRIVSVEAEHTDRRVRATTARATIQQWALRHITEEMLTAFANRKRSGVYNAHVHPHSVGVDQRGMTRA